MLETLQNAGLDFWLTLCEMSPYLLFGFLMAGVLSVLVSPERVERHLGGHGFWPVFKAALFGVPLPLCSCSVIPVTASLRRHGASRGAATAFLISTPQTGVDSILVTLALLGPVFAVFRPLGALVSGIMGGGAVDALEPHGEADTEPAEECTDTCCTDNGRGRLARILSYGFVDLPRDIGRALLIGIFVAGVLSAALPNDFFVGVGSGVLAILVMMLLGIPVYVCATASIPVAAALMLKGVSPGAALAFLMTGPATNAAGIATVWKIMGRRTAVVYLVTVALTAFASGLILDYIFEFTASSAQEGMGWMLPQPVKVASAVALLLILGAAFFRLGAPKHNHEEAGGSCCHGEPKDGAAEAGHDGNCCH
jgi:uncharacterized membrane protein YraQ (UPF0718 family)